MKQTKDFILGFQHLIAMFGATTLVPLLTGLDVSVALFSAGIGTLIFHFCTERKVPVFLGSSFAFIPVIIAVGNTMGLQYAQGGIIVAGILYLLFAWLVKTVGIELINTLLPKYVIGTMITIIGISLIPVAIDMALARWTVAFITLGAAVLVMLEKRGFSSQLSVLIAITVGYLMSIPLGLVDFSIIKEASWISFPQFTSPKFNFEAIMIIAPVVLATFMEHLGDITANGTIVGKNFLVNPGLHKTLVGDGLATAFAGFIGAPANTTYGENTGVLAITKNYDPRVLRIAAVFAVCLAFIGKIGAILASIPVAVLGGISLLLFGMIAKIGVFTLAEDQSWKSIQKTIVILVMLFLGLGSVEIWKFSGVSLAALFGIVVNWLVVKLDFETGL